MEHISDSCTGPASTGLTLSVSFLTSRFQGTALKSLEAAVLTGPGGEDGELVLVISTVPLTANVTLPSALLASSPVVMDVVYRPARTPLLQQVPCRCSRVLADVVLFGVCGIDKRKLGVQLR